jgi:hypothetical protein
MADRNETNDRAADSIPASLHRKYTCIFRSCFDMARSNIYIIYTRHFGIYKRPFTFLRIVLDLSCSRVSKLSIFAADACAQYKIGFTLFLVQNYA